MVNFKLLKNKYSLSSNLILITFLIGIVNLFFYDYKSTQELIIFISILITRYLLFILIKRRFKWSRYLLVLIIIRSVYRLYVVAGDVDINPVTKINLSLQAVISILAFAILFIVPKLKEWTNERRKYLSAARVSNAQH
ncbi:Ca2+/Na+ antiporter [Flavobacterium sp. W4I14]|nr:Ca2+/Na+ antiporter [Flavobacterium sp. W4I14]